MVSTLKLATRIHLNKNEPDLSSSFCLEETIAAVLNADTGPSKNL
jgi:hypothetical protein